LNKNDFKISRFFNNIGLANSRSKKIGQHILLSFFFKGGSILISFLLVPLTIKFLDTEKYGIWLTLNSFVGWVSLFDLGLGNGLRNKFAEAKAQGNKSLARGYISSAYIFFCSITILLIVLFLMLSRYINWTIILNTSPNLKNDLAILVPFVFSLFCFQILLKLITSIYSADQKQSFPVLISFLTQLITLIILWIVTVYAESSLLLFGIIVAISPVLILIGFNLYSFKHEYYNYRPNFNYVKKQYMKDVFQLGLTFFIIQISGLILFSTDTYIISKLFSPKEVVSYSIAFKYMGTLSTVFSLIATPFWIGYTDAYNRNDFEWIINSTNNLRKLGFFFIVLLGFFLVFSNLIYLKWVGSKVIINFSLTFCFAIFFAIVIFVTPYTYFLNGTGKIKIQLIQSVLVAIFNIPLSIYLCQIKFLGVNGVILATIICMLPSIFLAPYQYKKIISNRAKGIWNK
jgi:O-antigen/teichoic acid export membrane protein